MSGDGAALLGGVRVVSLAVNLPGPVAASRLASLGARVVKVEPPTGDPLRTIAASWYAELAQGHDVRVLDLKDDDGRAALDDLLATADLLLTSSQPGALARLGLGWSELSARFPRLCQVAIVGHLAPDDDVAGHDLTYQAVAGTLIPPAMPTVLIADLAGAERAVSEGLAALICRDTNGSTSYRSAVTLTVPPATAKWRCPRSVRTSPSPSATVSRHRPVCWEARSRHTGCMRRPPVTSRSRRSNPTSGRSCWR